MTKYTMVRCVGIEGKELRLEEACDSIRVRLIEDDEVVSENVYEQPDQAYDKYSSLLRINFSS